MTWYFAGAAIIAGLFALNAVFVYWMRSRRAMPHESTLALAKRPQSGVQVAVALLVTAGLMTCFGAPFIAPGSAFGQAMARPWAVVCTVPYMMAIGAAISVVAHLRRGRRTALGR